MRAAPQHNHVLGGARFREQVAAMLGQRLDGAVAAKRCGPQRWPATGLRMRCQQRIYRLRLRFLSPDDIAVVAFEFDQHALARGNAGSSERRNRDLVRDEHGRGTVRGLRPEEHSQCAEMRFSVLGQFGAIATER